MHIKGGSSVELQIHISQISLRVKNWYQNVTFGAQFAYGQFR